MPFLLAEILNFQGSTHRIGVGSFSKLVPVKEFEDDGHEVYGMKISYKKLWKQLIDEDMMKKDLQQKAGISWATMTKMSKGEVVSTEVLMKVCQVLHCNVGDIIDFIEDDPE